MITEQSRVVMSSREIVLSAGVSADILISAGRVVPVNMRQWDIYDGRDDSYRGTVWAGTAGLAILVYRIAANAATMPVTRRSCPSSAGARAWSR